QPAESFLRSCSPTSSRRIRRFALHGGPDLRDLRGYRFTGPKHKMSSRESSLGRRKRGSQSPVKSSGTPNTTTTKSTGPYDSNFQQHLTNRGVYPARYTYPDGKALPRPDNMDEIKRVLGQPRPSLSPSQFSEGAFDAFQDADTHAGKEAQVMARGPDGSLSVASRQACYDGALGARGIHSLQSYKQSGPQYDNKAYTLTSIYHGGTLKMYTSHPIPPPAPGERPGFAMTQIKTWGLT
ncbi:hypothetical protein TOPH_08723, partial [Tolypocladium ophioglossoides CBS 100239]